MSKIIFITGVNGVGKSAIMPHLIKLLPPDKYAVFDFDKRGVPENADKVWRISEAKNWLAEGLRLAKDDKNTIICGFVKPTDLDGLVEFKSPEVSMILLDSTPEIIRERLMKRHGKSLQVIGKSIEEFIAGNIYTLGKLKEMCEAKRYPIIDTSNLTPEEVAQNICVILSPQTKNLSSLNQDRSFPPIGEARHRSGGTGVQDDAGTPVL